MNNIIKLAPKQQQELFIATAGKLHLTPQIVEKDFWVCWVLNQLFLSPLTNLLIFKGGTSLSKVYGKIERFSEDIDLILNWKGNPVGDPMGQRASKKERQRFNEELLQWGNDVIKHKIYPIVCRFCEGICHAELTHPGTGDAIITIQYPHLYPTDRYLRPEIRLEIGALAAWDPHTTHTITAYAAQCYPQLFTEPNIAVEVTTLERTFWEKATILHTEAGRPEGNSFRARYSRHYYDLIMLARDAELKQRAFHSLDLLRKVVDFKSRFYGGSAWLAYDKATPGTFRLLPPQYRIQDLQKDYAAMRDMIYGENPSFETLLQEIQVLEAEINALATDATIQKA